MLWLLLLSSPALACTFPAPQPLLIDTSLEDDLPPAAPVVLGSDVGRGQGPRRRFLFSTTTSCDDLGWITIDVERPEGDPDPEDSIGYRIEAIEGTLPDNLTLAGTDAWLGPTLRLTWGDEATDDQEPFEATLALTPVDLAGNEGEPALVVVADEGGSERGCRTAPVPVGGAGWLVLLLCHRWKQARAGL